MCLGLDGKQFNTKFRYSFDFCRLLGNKLFYSFSFHLFIDKMATSNIFKAGLTNGNGIHAKRETFLFTSESVGEGHPGMLISFVFAIYFSFGSGYFAVDGNLPSETILP